VGFLLGKRALSKVIRTIINQGLANKKSSFFFFYKKVFLMGSNPVLSECFFELKNCEYWWMFLRNCILSQANYCLCYFFFCLMTVAWTDGGT